MSSGSSTTTQRADPEIRALGLSNYQHALSGANQPFQPFDPSSINRYMSPYINDVINAGSADLNKQRNTVLEQNASQQTAQHAFGGDRGAVMDAMTNNDFAGQLASFVANTRNAGFNSAAGLAEDNWKAQEMYPMLWQGILNQGVGAMGTGNTSSTTSQSPNWLGLLGQLGGDAMMAFG
jgi:hypothetical protein